MSEKKIIAPLRQLTDLEYACISGIAQIKEVQDRVKPDTENRESFRVPIVIRSVESKIAVEIAKKFGLSAEELKDHNFDLTLKSGHFVELLDKNEETNNTSGE